MMNGILQPFIRKFVIVFFDDILVFSHSWAEHLQHVKEVFAVLREHKLALKQSKCTFGEESVSYLGHVVTTNSVAIDLAMVAAMEIWPRPRTVHGLRGLTNYYRKFVAGYGTMAAPLTALLMKDAFSWMSEADEAFVALKQAMTAPLLQMLDFDKCFIVDCDASGSGFGAVLHQGDGPIAFFSRVVAPHHATLPAYERELIGLVKAVHNWRPYLWDRPFIIRTDHYSMKFIVDQRLTTIPQHTWVRKLFGYDLSVEYRPGMFNVVVDALSRRDEEAPAVCALSAPEFPLFDTLRADMLQDPQALAVRAKLHMSSSFHPQSDGQSEVTNQGRTLSKI